MSWEDKIAWISVTSLDCTQESVGALIKCIKWICVSGGEDNYFFWRPHVVPDS